jgi:hypothetical protein
VTFRWESETQGLTTLGTVSVTRGTRFNEATFKTALPAGAWVSAELITASGATEVSASLTVQVGGTT